MPLSPRWAPKPMWLSSMEPNLAARFPFIWNYTIHARKASYAKYTRTTAFRCLQFLDLRTSWKNGWLPSLLPKPTMSLQLHCSSSSPMCSTLCHSRWPRSVLLATAGISFQPKSLKIFVNHARSSRIRRPSSQNCSTINGFAVEENPKNLESGAEKLEFRNRVEWLISIIRSILPGGGWWSFSDEIELNLATKPVTIFRALRKMWELVFEDRWVIIVAFSTLIVAAFSEIFIPHYLTASIFAAKKDVAMFNRNMRILFLLCVTSGICSGIRGCCFGIANMTLVKRMRETLYSSLLSQDISFFDDQTVGNLTSRLGSDCQQVSRVIGYDLNLIFRNVLQGGGALVYLFVLSCPLALCTLAICFALAAAMIIYGRYQKMTAKLVQEITASANDVAQETFSLIRTVRVYGTEKRELGRYNVWLDKLAAVSLRQSAAYGIWNMSFNTFYHSTQVLAVLIGGMSIMAGHLTTEKLTKFILYSEWLIYSTWLVGDNLSSLMQSVGASEKVFQMMDLKPSDQFMFKGKEPRELTGSIEFVKMSFYYPSRGRAPVLHNINLSMNPGEVVALVGLSGSGKSTLVNLLLRLYEPSSGQILIGGVPVQDLDIKWLRERIGYVGQEPRLFRMDIASNISYGCTRQIKSNDIVWAAKQAYAHDFISELPQGYKTLVDDDLLSGGQKQRIAIARAILRDPAILILDEATSALDAESEHNVKGVLRALKSDSTSRRSVVVIAHRLSTIQAADRIVVMDSGRIIEMGNHGELLRKNGLYARLTSRQADAVA